MLSLENFLTAHKIKGKIACACSGGADSLAMTYLLAQSHEVVALIIDHGLRKDSAAEAKQTAKILDKLKIQNVILSKKNKIKSNLQEEARKLRYGLLTDYCKKNKIKYLATAHHADDNAETFLLRLSRGSGVDGLSGMAPVSEMNGVKLIRPVLKFTKFELENFLKIKKIKPVEDPTNRTDKYKRNNLRHALEKLEDKELITKRINDASENLGRVRDFLEAETERSFRKTVIIQSDRAMLDVKAVEALHDEIAYRVLVKLIMQLAKAEKKPRFEKLKRLKTDIMANKVRTLNGLIFRPKGGKVIITIEKP